MERINLPEGPEDFSDVVEPSEYQKLLEQNKMQIDLALEAGGEIMSWMNKYGESFRELMDENPDSTIAEIRANIEKKRKEIKERKEKTYH